MSKQFHAAKSMIEITKELYMDDILYDIFIIRIQILNIIYTHLKNSKLFLILDKLC